VVHLSQIVKGPLSLEALLVLLAPPPHLRDSCCRHREQVSPLPLLPVHLFVLRARSWRWRKFKIKRCYCCLKPIWIRNQNEGVNWHGEPPPSRCHCKGEDAILDEQLLPWFDVLQAEQSDLVVACVDRHSRDPSWLVHFVDQIEHRSKGKLFVSPKRTGAGSAYRPDTV